MPAPGAEAHDYGGAILLAACFTAGTAIVRFAPAAPHPLGLAAAVLALGAFFLRPSLSALGACGLCFGLLSSWTPPSNAVWPASMEGVFSGTVVSRSVDAWGKDRVMVEARPASPLAGGRGFRVLLSMQEDGPPEPGETIRFHCRLRKMPSAGGLEPSFAGTVEAGGWTRIDGRGFARVVGAVRRRVRRATSRESPGAGIYRSLLLGDRSRIPWDCMRAFRRTGTSHLLAISGLNLAAAFAVGAIAGLPFSAFLAIRSLPILSLTARLVAGLGAAGAYLALCGWSSAASRALVWAVLAGLAPVLRRLGNPLIGAAVCLVALGAPSAGKQPDLSLTLSLLAFVAVVRCLDRRDGHLVGAVRVTLGACLYTAPVTVWVFGTMPTLAIPFNVVVGLPFSLVLIPGALLGGLASLVNQTAGEWSLFVWEAAARPFLALLRWGADLPGACLSLNASGRLAGVAVSLAAVFVWERKGRRLALGILLTVLAAGAAWTACAAQRAVEGRRLTVDFPSIGQADAAIIRAGGRTVIVDCGPPGPPWRDPPILEALDRAGIAAVDLVILTHGHPDHSGGAEAVLRALDVRMVMVPRGILGSYPFRSLVGRGRRDTEWIEAASGDVKAFGDLIVRVRHPPAADLPDGGNAGSLVPEVSWRGRRILLAGDAPWEAVGRAISEAGEPDILKLPHHGSGTGFDPPAWSPVLHGMAVHGTAAVCTAHPSGHGLPADSVRQAFGRAGLDLRFPEPPNGLRFSLPSRGRRGSPALSSRSFPERVGVGGRRSAAGSPRLTTP